MITIIVFTVEYIMRLWVSSLSYPDISPLSARIKYAFSFMAIIDLLAILPFYLPFLIRVDLRVLRTLRMFRLTRLLKVNRYTTALKAIADVLRKKSSQLLSSMIIVFILMIISSIIIYNVENPAQPGVFSNAFSGMWWSVVTLTTVGYGDIYPITVTGKIFSAVISILGIGLIAIPTGIISAGFIEKISEQKALPGAADENIKENKQYCPYCGRNLKN